jgi:hypothetical protein
MKKLLDRVFFYEAQPTLNLQKNHFNLHSKVEERFSKISCKNLPIALLTVVAL